MNADPIARGYRWFEYSVFGRALERRRLAFLLELAGARRALLLGEGDGRFLAEWVKQNPEAEIDCVDLSGRMLELARGRAGSGQVRYWKADALEMPLDDSAYDLIVTHFFLDCLDEADTARLIERVAKAARGDAVWVVSEFRAPTAWGRWFVRALYFFFRITTGLKTRELVEYAPLLRERGFELRQSQSAWRGLLVSELWMRAE